MGNILTVNDATKSKKFYKKLMEKLLTAIQEKKTSVSLEIIKREVLSSSKLVYTEKSLQELIPLAHREAVIKFMACLIKKNYPHEYVFSSQDIISTYPARTTYSMRINIILV